MKSFKKGCLRRQTFALNTAIAMQCNPVLHSDIKKEIFYAMRIELVHIHNIKTAFVDRKSELSDFYVTARHFNYVN